MAILNLNSWNANYPSEVKIVKAQFTSSVEGTSIVNKVNGGTPIVNEVNESTPIVNEVNEGTSIVDEGNEDTSIVE